MHVSYNPTRLPARDWTQIKAGPVKKKMTAMSGALFADLQYLEATGMRKTNPIAGHARQAAGSVHLNLQNAAGIVPSAAAMVQEHREEALPMLSRGFWT